MKRQWLTNKIKNDLVVHKGASRGETRFRQTALVFFARALVVGDLVAVTSKLRVRVKVNADWRLLRESSASASTLA